MDTITIIRQKIENVRKQQDAILPLAYQGNKSAINQSLAYAKRIEAMENTIMELQGLGDTVMLNFQISDRQNLSSSKKKNNKKI